MSWVCGMAASSSRRSTAGPISAACSREHPLIAIPEVLHAGPLTRPGGGERMAIHRRGRHLLGVPPERFEVEAGDRLRVPEEGRVAVHQREGLAETEAQAVPALVVLRGTLDEAPHELRDLLFARVAPRRGGRRSDQRLEALVAHPEIPQVYAVGGPQRCAGRPQVVRALLEGDHAALELVGAPPRLSLEVRAELVKEPHAGLHHALSHEARGRGSGGRAQGQGLGGGARSKRRLEARPWGVDGGGGG